MANGHTSGKHQDDQKQRWRDFHYKLNQLKEQKPRLSVSNVEMAEGLNISRQRLFEFMKKPEKGLPIQRGDVLDLWDYLTTPEAIARKTIAAEAKENRKLLLQEYPQRLDELLKAAGFLPVSEVSAPERPQIERIRQRLLSGWIPSDSDLCDITDSILESISAKGGLLNDRQEKSKTEKGYTAEEAKQWPEKHLKAFEAKLQPIFARQISKFANSGKVQFQDIELFELYQSIRENNHFRQGLKVSMQVIDCQFKTVTFSLNNQLESYSQIKADLTEIFVQCEQQLRSDSKQPEPSAIHHIRERRILFPPVIQAVVTFIVEDEQEQESESWRLHYTSSTTHIENMLVALSNGLGYILPKVLTMTNMSIRSIGRMTESLARVSITLTDRKLDKTHQGIWIEQNTILGALKAFLSAVIDWLSQRLNSSDFPQFYETCQQLAEIDADLLSGIETIHNYADAVSLQESVIDKTEKLAEDMDELAKASVTGNNKKDERTRLFYKNCKENLDKKQFLALLMLVYRALIQCKINEASKYLKKLEGYLYLGGIESVSNPELTPIVVLYNSEVVFFNLLVGHKTFLDNAIWRETSSRFNLDYCLKELRDYIHKRNTGIIDFDVYLCAAKIFGIVALAEFYICQKIDAEHLEKAAKNFIAAAHYSARIGQKQRAAHLFCYASRTCCRLGQNGRAKALADLAERILPQETKLTSLDLIKQPFKAQVYLSKGERLLLLEPETSLEKASCYFLLAWEESKKHEHDRAAADSLYDLYRAFRELANQKPTDPFDKFNINALAIECSEQEKESIGKAFKDLKKECKTMPGDNYSSTAKVLKGKVQDKWNKWRKAEGTFVDNHPFADKIENDSFLELVNGVKGK